MDLDCDHILWFTHDMVTTYFLTNVNPYDYLLVENESNRQTIIHQ